MPDTSSFLGRRGGIIVVVVLCLIYFFTVDKSGTSDESVGTVEEQRATALAEELHYVRLINASRWQDFVHQQNKWLNISGLTEEAGFHWNGLAKAKALAVEQHRYALGHTNIANYTLTPAVYQNVSGSVDGPWQMAWNEPELSIPRKEGMITALSGEVLVHIDEFNLDDSTDQHAYDAGLSWIRATFSFYNPYSTGTIWKTRLHGLHIKSDGSIILASTSQKFGGVYALPHFVAKSSIFDKAKHFLTDQINKTITAQSESTAWISNPWTTSINGENLGSQQQTPPCELIVYLQQHVQYEGPGSDPFVERVERELRDPTGFLVAGRMQDMRYSLTAFSPDCGYIIRSRGPPNTTSSNDNHLSGPTAGAEVVRMRHHVLLFAIVLVCQLRLLVLQMAEAQRRPSTLSRLSALTFATIFVGDNGASMVLGTYSLINPELGMILLSTLFLAFICSMYFDLRLVVAIAAAQMSAVPRERNLSLRTSAQSTIDTVESGTLPLPATARRAANHGTETRNILARIRNETETTNGEAAVTTQRASPGGLLHAALLGMTFVMMFTTVSALSWRPAVQRIYFFSIALILMSAWVPQIYRNAVRNCRTALRWDFVLGQSILRLVPIAYFYIYPCNVFWTQQHWWLMYALIGWVWLQVLLLASQSFLGARWFLNASWLPPAYDYHPILIEDALQEQGLPIGAKDGGAGEPGWKFYECVICMQDLEVRTLSANDAADASLGRSAEAVLARRMYMMTPCRHIFHSKCLESWLDLRLQCPMCREPVPAI